jgi:hypothetical protein
MSSQTPIKSTFRKQFANAFIETFNTVSDDFYYLFYSRPYPWDNDLEAPISLDNFISVSECWNSMLGVQRIEPRDLSLIVNRYDWEKNTIYSQYDDELDLFNETCPLKFYVLNSDNRVYKCISNNKGTASLNEPISTTTNIFQTPDGYKWKFLYQVSEDKKKFLTSDFMPVETLRGISYTGELALQYDVQQKAIDGSVDQVEITQQGTYWPHTVVATHYDGPNQFEIQQNVAVKSASAGDTEIALNMKNILTYAGKVEDIVGYSVYIYSGMGAGQYIKIIKATPNGENDEELGYALLTLDKPLTRALSVSSNDISRFEILPTIEIYGNGEGAVAIPKMVESYSGSSQYVVDEVLMVNSGKDYSIIRMEAPRPSGSQDNLGDAKQTKLRPITSPPGGHGADPEVELGANDVIINVRTEGESGGSISVVNDFRRFGIIKNPIINMGPLAGQIAGEEQDERIRLRVIKPNQVRIDFDLGTGPDGDANVYPLNGGAEYDFIVGSEVTQEETGAKGIVLNWVPPLWNETDPTEGAGDELIGKLYLEVISGNFIKKSRTTDEATGEEIPGLAVYSSADGLPSYDKYNDTNQPFDLLDYTDETFDVGSTIIGTTSHSTAEIVDWAPDVSGLSGFIYLKNINGTFIVPRIDIETGKPISGERITQFANIDEYTGIFDIRNINIEGNDETNAGILGSDSSNLTIPLASYRQTYMLNVEVADGSNIFVPGDFDRTIDDPVTFTRNGEYLGQGYVVDSVISDDGNSAVVEVTGLKDWDGLFVAGDNITYIDTVGVIKSDILDPTGVSPDIEYPQLKPDSGEMLYIQNILPVMRNTERAEEMKLLLRF